MVVYKCSNSTTGLLLVLNETLLFTNFSWEKISNLYIANKNNNAAGDATWILTSAFIIFTMQSGFGLLEAGSCSAKNECNIMIKNAVDVIFGAFGYWVCGYAFSFGTDEDFTNGFTGYGHFFVHLDEKDFGYLYAHYFFQLSFATTATTIVSGGMAERTNLKAYMFFSFVNFLSYVFPAHWMWGEKGFLREMGGADIGGCGPVHLVGGAAALVATLMLKPRHKIFDEECEQRVMASPTNVVLGTFMLWWGWLGFNCGSTFGVSGGKWKLATRAAVTTVNSSVGGGLWAILYCYLFTNIYKGHLHVSELTSGILGSLVSITAICAICQPWEALLIGFIGGMICSYGSRLLKHMRIDDPVECIPIHMFCGMWGVIVVGIFGEKDELENLSRYNGIVKGGTWRLLGVQTLAVVAFIAWSVLTTFVELFVADKLFGLRVNLEDEITGADHKEHGIPIISTVCCKCHQEPNVDTNSTSDDLPWDNYFYQINNPFPSTQCESMNNVNGGMINFAFLSTKDSTIQSAASTSGANTLRVRPRTIHKQHKMRNLKWNRISKRKRMNDLNEVKSTINNNVVFVRKTEIEESFEENQETKN